jgi:effector-binding domain-containing protein
VVLTHVGAMGTYEIQSQPRQEQPTAVAQTALDVADIGPWLTATYGSVFNFLATHDSLPVGPPFARYQQLGGGRFQVEAGFPVAQAIQGEGDVIASVLPGGLVATTLHIGPYEAMEPAYEAVASWVDQQGGERTGDPWEVYFSDPQEEPDPDTWKTEVVQPYRATSATD